MSIKAYCGGLFIDNSTLKQVGGIITVAGATPTKSIQAGCGVLFDADNFKMVKGVLTDKDNMGTVSGIEAPCGGLVVDENCFGISSGALTFSGVSGECEITSFKIGTAVGTIEGTEISVEVASGTDVTSLSPTIVVSEGATVAPTSGTAKDFTNPVEYVVTAEGGGTKTYKVTVTVAS